MQALGGENVGFDPAIEGHKRKIGCADLIGQCRQAERHAFAGETLRLAVQGLVLAVLVEHGEEPGPTQPRGTVWNGGWVIVSQSRHENRSRTSG